MVKAILEGRKCMTRRVVKLDKFNPYIKKSIKIKKDISIDLMGLLPHGWRFLENIKCPYGQIGDHLWIKETWMINYKTKKPSYKADCGIIDYGDWKSSLFMPRKFSRITLEIIDIKVERLQEMREGDVIAEGIITPSMIRKPDESKKLWQDFKNLWNSIHKKEHTWKDNPYVWCLTFKKINEK